MAYLLAAAGVLYMFLPLIVAYKLDTRRERLVKEARALDLRPLCSEYSLLIYPLGLGVIFNVSSWWWLYAFLIGPWVLIGIVWAIMRVDRWRIERQQRAT